MKSGSLNYPWAQAHIINTSAILGWHYISRLFSNLIRLEIIKWYYFFVNWGLWPSNLMPSLLYEKNAERPTETHNCVLSKWWSDASSFLQIVGYGQLRNIANLFLKHSEHYFQESCIYIYIYLRSFIDAIAEARGK